MDLKTRYVVKGIGKEQTITSVINIFTNPDGSKIEKLEDKWDGSLPDSGFQNVIFPTPLTPRYRLGLANDFAHRHCVRLMHFLSPNSCQYQKMKKRKRQRETSRAWYDSKKGQSLALFDYKDIE